MSPIERERKCGGVEGVVSYGEGMAHLSMHSRKQHSVLEEQYSKKLASGHLWLSEAETIGHNIHK